MGVAVFGHWGPPLLAFPTSHGDEWELQRHGMIDALADFIDGGRVKLFCVGSNNHESFLNSAAHPFHRSWRQRMFDEYIREEVFPFIYSSCQTDTIAISTRSVRAVASASWPAAWVPRTPIDDWKTIGMATIRITTSTKETSMSGVMLTSSMPAGPRPFEPEAPIAGSYALAASAVRLVPLPVASAIRSFRAWCSLWVSMTCMRRRK